MSKHKRMTAIYLAIIVVVGTILLYWDLSFPSLTPTMAFRREEAHRLLGPAEILDTLEIDYLIHDRITLGRSDYGYSLYNWSQGQNYDIGNFLYYPKEEGLTFVQGIQFDLISYMAGWQYPFFVFSEDARAAKASFRLEITSEAGTQVYTLEARKQFDCLFLFCLDEENVGGEAFRLLSQAMTSSLSDIRAQIQVTVFDTSGQEVSNKTVDYPKEVAHETE